jgi:DNA polymerase-3 subunit gamma/tau
LIAAHLKHILDVEAIGADLGALNLLARSAAGSMRDALSLLDQAIAHGAGRVEEAQVREMLGAVDLDHLFTIVDALLAGDAEALLRVADAMTARSLSFDAALQEMASLLTRLQIAQLAPQSIADDTPERERLLALADRFDPEFVQLAYQIAVHGRKELPLAPDEQAGFVMTLLRLHAFRPLDDDSRANAVGVGTGVRETRGVPPKADGVRLPATPMGERAATPARAAERKPVAGVDASQQSVALAPGSIATVSLSSRNETVASDWHTILSELKLTGMARELGQHCALRDRSADDRGEGRFVLRLSPVHRPLLIKAAQDKLQQALTDYFRKPVSLAIELDAAAGDTPAAAMRRDRQARMDQAVASVEKDSFVREVIEIFDATLIESSIQPV